MSAFEHPDNPAAPCAASGQQTGSSPPTPTVKPTGDLTNGLPRHAVAGQDLFSVTVAYCPSADVVPDMNASDDEFADDVDRTSPPDAPDAPSDVEVREMALAALEAVWFDVWASPGRTFRGQDVVVSVYLPDGTLLGDASK